MPQQVSIYRPQMRVPELQAPEIRRTGNAEALVQSIGQVSQAVEQERNRMRATKLGEARLQTATQLEELQFEAEKQPWDQRAAFFEQGAQRIRSDVEKGMGGDAVMRSAFAEDWGRSFLPRNMEVRHSARKGEIDHNGALLDDSLTVFARQASQSSDERLSQFVKDQAAVTIADAQQGGFITETEAGNRLREFARTVERNRVTAMIGDPSKGGPNAAVRALSDLNQFQNLREEDRLMLVGRAESKLQHQVTMAEAAASRADRARRRYGEELAKDGWDHIAKGTMSDDWLTESKATLDATDYRALVAATQGGGGANSSELIADTYRKLYVDGEDVSGDVLQGLRNRVITPDTAKTLLDENKQTQGVKSPARLGREYITTYLKPGELNPSIGAPERLANAMQEFDDTLRENPKMNAAQVRRLAAGISKRYSVINREAITVTLPTPRFADGERNTFDVRKTRAATVKNYLAKHGGDKDAMRRDPEYVREVRNIKLWEDARERAAAAARAADELEKE